MARLAVLTDRLPDDPSWKGACTWEIIRGLAESQHEVVVFTTEDPDRVNVTHPRLTIARPAPNWKVDRMPRWAQALLNFRPEVIHTFALKPMSLWPSLTVWPYLDALCKVLPGVTRVSTMFEAEDFTHGSAWHAGSQSWTVFSPVHQAAARAHFERRIEVVPLDELQAKNSTDESFDEESGYTLVPAPVSEWVHREHGLAQLADHLLADPSRQAWINGGWGELSLSERRRGWMALSAVAARVRLTETLSFPRFVGRVRGAGRVWLEALSEDSWRYLLSAQIGRQLGKELLGKAPRRSDFSSGSTANFLSRIYLS